MANINLNNYFRNPQDKVSPVDSKIILDKDDTKIQRWGDLKMDLQFNEIKERALNAKESTKDLQRTINEESVIVSLRNIFNTRKCSRLLNPEVDFQIGQYLFEPVNQTSAWFLGYDIYNTLPMYEPRIKINSINVIADQENSLYIIELEVGVPSISGENFKISSVLSQDGYEIF